MRKYLFITVMVTAALLAACPGSPADSTPPAEPVSINLTDSFNGFGQDTTTVSDPVTVTGGNQQISLSGLESGRLYTIYAREAGAAAVSAAAGTAKVAITSLGGGTYAFILPEGETEIVFTAAEIGLRNGGEFRIGRITVPETDFRDGTDGMTIGQGVTQPVFTTPDGAEYYEAFYSIDTDSIPDASRVVITEIISHKGNAKISHYFSFVDENGKKLEGGNEEAILDLSGHTTIYLWQKMQVDYSDQDQTSTLYFLSPGLINKEGSTSISAPGTYIIEASSSGQYMIVEGLADSNRGLGTFVNDINARYTDTGERLSRVFPIAVTDEEVIINIPAHSRDIMFDYDGDTFSVHLEKADGSYEVETLRKGTNTFTVEEGVYLFPVLPSGIPADSRISLSTESPDGQLRIAYIQPTGHGITSIRDGGSYDLGTKKSSVPEYLYFQNPSRKACSFTVRVE